MTKGIIDMQVATTLHKTVLPLIALIAFTGHTSLAIRMALLRWRIWNTASMIGLWALYMILVLSCIYFQLLYTPSQQASSPAVYAPQIQQVIPSAVETNQTITPMTTNEVTVTNTPSTEKIFSAQELATFDGKNGNKAYAAVDGIVYDVSQVFRNGNHQGYTAGQDLSASFYTKHMKSILSRFPIVGKLQ